MNALATKLAPHKETPYSKQSAHSAQPECCRDIDSIIELPADFTLQHGGVPSSQTVQYRLSGPIDAPVVVVLGGISASRHVVESVEGYKGWWADFVCAQGAVDTDRFRILSFEFALPNTESNSAPQRAITTLDQARVLAVLLNRIGVEQAHSVIGASYGGMVAIAFAAAFPDQVGRTVVLNAAHEPAPMATAWRSIQRKIVELGRGREDVVSFLQLARQLAMTTYRTTPEFDDRFNGEARLDDEAITFPVEDYLENRGATWADETGVERFLSLSQSIDLHRVQPEDITGPVLLLGCQEDQLIPIHQMRELSDRVGSNGGLHEFSSPFGHDSFLKETGEISPVIAKFIGEGK